MCDGRRGPVSSCSDAMLLAASTANKNKNNQSAAQKSTKSIYESALAISRCKIQGTIFDEPR